MVLFLIAFSLIVESGNGCGVCQFKVSQDDCEWVCH